MALNVYNFDDQLHMTCDNGLFDNIDDLLDFSTDDEVLGMVDSAAASGSGGGSSQEMAQLEPAAKAFPPAVEGDGCRVAAAAAAAPEVSKICNDINLGEDWFTNFLDESNFDIGFPVSTSMATVAVVATPKVDDIHKDETLFQSFSPTSVLEPSNLGRGHEKGGSSSSSSSSYSSSSQNELAETVSVAPVGPTMMLVPARARSKRPRRAAQAPVHVTVPILPPATEGPPVIPTLLPECESYGESDPCPPPMKKKKKKNLIAGGNSSGSGSEDGMAVRKCLHCGIQKTPQWRAGPMGPKTLCNACGVRYKSGRLFPEYRPAASPTFVPSIHSNSHKKVVEMRNKATQQKTANGIPLPEYPAAKNCDLLAYIRRGE